MIFRCQPGFEDLLRDELAAHPWTAIEGGGGWLRADPGAAVAAEALPAVLAGADLCFPSAVLVDPVEMGGESVNQLATRIAEHFLATAREERFDGHWPLVVETAAGLDGLGRRAAAVAEATREILKKRMGRVMRLAATESPVRVGVARGLWLFFADYRRVFVARTAVLGGQRRMSDDALAPSRSYLKVEEAYGLLGCEPREGELVVDLGAAPGGWSYSAARRGARVRAIDNGPLKGGALGHPLIEHLREDAFHHRLAPGEVCDWLFCDLVEEPHHVWHDLVEPWIAGGWCRRFVVNLKFGRVAPLGLLRELRHGGGVLERRAAQVRIRHLYHDREELTVVGVVSTR